MYFLYSEKFNLMMKKNKKGDYNVVWWVQGEVSFRGSIGAYGWVDNSLDIEAAVQRGWTKEDRRVARGRMVIKYVLRRGDTCVKVWGAGEQDCSV